MFVFTSVMVTPTPGSTRPPESMTFPTSDPFTACAAALPAHVNTSTSSAPNARPRRPITSSLTSYNEQLFSCAAGRRQFLDSDVAKPHLVAVVLQQDVPFELRAPAGFILELALCLRRLHRRAFQLVFDHFHAVH